MELDIVVAVPVVQIEGSEAVVEVFVVLTGVVVVELVQSGEENIFYLNLNVNAIKILYVWLLWFLLLLWLLIFVVRNSLTIFVRCFVN